MSSQLTANVLFEILSAYVVHYKNVEKEKKVTKLVEHLLVMMKKAFSYVEDIIMSSKGSQVDDQTAAVTLNMHGGFSVI